MAHKWKFVCKLEKNGHRLFMDESNGKVAIADNSGHFPDQTDDGALWLDFTRSIAIGRDFTAALPVTKERDNGEYHVGVGLEGLVTVLESYPQWKVRMDETQHKLIRSLGVRELGL